MRGAIPYIHAQLTLPSQRSLSSGSIGERRPRIRGGWRPAGLANHGAGNDAPDLGLVAQGRRCSSDVADVERTDKR